MKMKWCFVSLLLVFTACSRTPEVIVRSTIPQGSDIAVIIFQDCTIAGQEDCDGSGNIAANIFAEVIARSGKFRAVPLSRPVGPKAPLTDDVAISLAKSKGFKFVLNGEVTEFYSVAPMTFRVDRAGVSVRLLNVEDGSVVAFFSQRKEANSNIATPNGLIEKMAEHVCESLK